MRLRWLDIENDATFHRNQDFGDVNNKLEKVMQVLDDQIVFVVPHFNESIPRWHYIPRLYAYTPLKRKNNRPNLPFTSILYSLAQQRKTRWSILVVVVTTTMKIGDDDDGDDDDDVGLPRRTTAKICGIDNNRIILLKCFF